jgi:glycosyltransferase involved in cell wall biosynthesis
VSKAVEIAGRTIGNLTLDTYFGKGIPQEHMAETYSRADIFVDMQWHTGCGWNNPVAEAMACRVPVICTDIGGVRDFARHEKTALLVRPDDTPQLADAIVRLEQDRGLRETLAKGGYEAITRFDWNESAKNLQSILKKNMEG